MREFSLAALVQQYFGVTLTKGSQKANWAQRPLPRQMAEYAMNDTHYLLPLAEKMEAELREQGRLEWFQAIVSARAGADCDSNGCAMQMRPGGSVARARFRREPLRSCARFGNGVISEAQAADRPSFHILQNHLLVQAAQSFETGQAPEFRHLTPRRRRGFIDAAEEALRLSESEWPMRVRAQWRATDAGDGANGGRFAATP